MRISRFLCLLLCLSFLLPVFSSCGGGGTESRPSSESESESESASSSESSSEEGRDKWEGVSFGGEELIVNVSVHYNDEQTFGPADVYSRGPDSLEGADEVGKMIYDRNLRLQTRLGLSVTWEETNVKVTFAQGVIENFVRLSPDNSPDLFINDHSDLIHAMLTGCLWNVYDPTDAGGDPLPSYFDFSHEGWMENFMKGSSMDSEKRYLLASDYFIDAIRYAFVLYVNRDLFDETMQGQFLTVHDLYRHVLVGDWDYLFLKELIETVYRDTVNKGETDREDEWKGLVASQLFQRAFSWTNGLSVLEWDGEIYDSTPSVIENNADYFTFVENFRDLFNTPGVLYTANDVQASTTLFLDGTYLFALSMMGEMESEQVRNSAVNKGVLPIPKFDLTIQDDYHTLIHNQAEMACIPVNARRFCAASAYMQMATEESVAIMKEYYDKSLKLKYNEDKDTQEMLDLIHDRIESPFESVLVRLVMTGAATLPEAPYQGEAMFNMIYNDAVGNKNEFTSTYAKHYEGWCKNLTRLLEIFENLE